MHDLVLGALILLVVSAGLFLLGERIARRASRRWAALAGIAGVGFLVAFGLGLHGTARLARWVPFSNAIVLANWIPPGAALLAGLAWGNGALARWRRGLWVVFLGAVAVYALLKPLVGRAPAVRDHWTADGVCLQSSPASCSAASAATLLRHHGIDATEEEMVELCLTDARATSQLGLFRGLKLKTRGSPWQVESFRGDVDELRRQDTWPAILLVMLPARADVDPRYENQWGWTPGLGHAVVVYGLEPEGWVEVGDPSIGREHWALADLQVLWQGEAFRLIPRATHSPN